MVWFAAIPIIIGLIGGAVYLSQLKGKVFAILGPRLSGKTSLINFLLKGHLPEEYLTEKTAIPRKFEGKTVNLAKIELKISGTDVPGTNAALGIWEEQYRKADVVCYLMDVSRILKNEERYIESLENDMRHIGEWKKDRKNNLPKFFLIGTHCDLVHNYHRLSKDGKTDFDDTFWESDVPKRLLMLGGGSDYVKRVTGSLRGKDDVTRLAGLILRQLV